MDKTKICEALYALPGEIVVRRRRSMGLPLALLAAGALLLIVNGAYGAGFSNDVRSALVFTGGVAALAGVIALAVRIFSAGGVPYHSGARCFLRYEELCFDRAARGDVVGTVNEGAVERLLELPRAHVPAVAVAIYRTDDNRFAAMQAYEYADLEYRPLTGLKIVGDDPGPDRKKV